MRKNLLLVGMLVLAMSVSAIAKVLYDFDSLTPDSSIVGQDGWALSFGSSGTPQVEDSYSGWNGISGNCVQMISSEPQFTRVGDNLGITNTNISVEFVAIVGSGAEARIALAGDVGGDGAITVTNELAFAFGYYEWENRGFFIRAAGNGAQWRSDMLVSTGVYRFVLDVDLTANGGDGSASLAIQQLANGTGVAVSDTLTAVSGLQNINIELNRMDDSVENASTWNALYLRGKNNSAIDSIVISGDVIEDKANTPDPMDGATGVAVSKDLTWIAPTEYTPSSYDVYFGTDSNPYNNTKYTVHTESFSPPVDLEYNTAYYWVVDSYDGSTKYAGSSWDFKTISPLTLSKPTSRSVFQRNGQNTSMVPIEGTYTSTVTRIEARAIVMDGHNGTSTDWQTIDAAPAGGTFSATLEVTAGGWYRIEARPFNGDISEITVGVDKVGVGEVFITAGQSNSANCGIPIMIPTHDTVSAWTGSAWRHAYDPQPIASNSGGSPWSRLGDILVDEFDVPIAFISVGVGGTHVERWVPSANDLYPRIQDAIQTLGTYGFRAVLWHQGESDAVYDGQPPTDTQTYAARLRQVISQSRIDADFHVPWGIALAAWMPRDSYWNQQDEWQLAIRQAQLQVIQGDPYNFQGPDTDAWTGTEYRHDTVHFNGTGLQLHAEGWMQSIKRLIYPWDTNQDKDINLTDFSTFSSHWQENVSHLAAYWAMDETAGSSATDSSGNDRDGILMNGPVWAYGKIGGALSFDGTDDYVEVTGYKGVTGTASRTCTAWIKTSSTSTQDIFSWGESATGKKWEFGLMSNVLSVRVQGGNLFGSTVLTDDTWHHIAVVWAPGSDGLMSHAVLYVDGVEETIGSLMDIALDTGSEQDVRIGSFNGGNYFQGVIDDVRIYDVALSADEVAQIVKPTYDFDLNGMVGLADLSIFAVHWLE